MHNRYLYDDLINILYVQYYYSHVNSSCNNRYISKLNLNGYTHTCICYPIVWVNTPCITKATYF